MESVGKLALPFVFRSLRRVVRKQTAWLVHCQRDARAQNSVDCCGPPVSNASSRGEFSGAQQNVVPKLIGDPATLPAAVNPATLAAPARTIKFLGPPQGTDSFLEGNQKHRVCVSALCD